jgi:hypothetical protein
MQDRSTPIFSEFDPTHIPFQARAIADIDFKLDYSLGTHELLFSGSVGSSKTTLVAHIIMKHALKYPNTRIGIGRKSLVDLKATLFRTICEHLEDQKIEPYIEKVLDNTAQIHLSNGTIIESISWSDKRFVKFRSRIYSLFVFEEAIENEGDFYQALIECRQRVGRIPHVKENLIIYCTNPAGPSHPLYKYFFTDRSPTRHIYFSLTEENPFLPRTYIEQLKRDLPPKEAMRMLEGKWVEIDRERVYYAYSEENNFVRAEYSLRPDVPVSLAFDFNIALGKPMSAVLSQYIKETDTFHFFDECVVYGSRTEDVLEELQARGYFDLNVRWEIHGDGTGGTRTTNSKYSNYDLISNFMANYKPKTGLKLNYQMLVPKSNPPIRERHIIVNGYCLNSLKQVRLLVYQKCKVLNEGMMLTTLKKGADYIEDDGPKHPYQHSTTACGYRVVYTSRNKTIVKGGNF